MTEAKHYKHVSENGFCRIIKQQQALMCLEKMILVKGLLYERSLLMKKEKHKK